MRHPCPTLLFDIAVADAYGAGFEGVENRDHFANNRLMSYVKHPALLHIPGQYTDDTQMSIAVAEVLLTDYHESGDWYIRWFLEAFRRDPRSGYSGNFQRRLEAITTDARGNRLPSITPQQILAFHHLVDRFSKRNGSAMRSVPIGAVPEPSRVFQIAAVQAQTTHNTEAGILASRAVAALSHFSFHTDRTFIEFPDFWELHRQQPWPFAVNWHRPVKFASETIALDTIHAVYSLLCNSPNRLEVLRQAINLGGDTDTVAAIAFGIASIRDQTPLPQALIDGLENGPYGRDYLFQLGQRLMEKYG